MRSLMWLHTRAALHICAPSRPSPRFAMAKSLSRLDEVRLLTKVATLYYEDELTEAEIADRVQLSRSKISRLLKQARREGIVRSIVVPLAGADQELERNLAERFGLSSAVVVEVSDPHSPERVAHELGAVAANHLLQTLKPNAVVGLAWGFTLESMIAALPRHPVPGSHVVQLIGGLGRPDAAEHASELGRRLAPLLGATLSLLPAQGIAATPDIYEALLSDRHVQEVFSLYHRLTDAYVGIGSLGPDGHLLRGGQHILDSSRIQEIKSQGAVGDICLRFFDQSGRPLTGGVADLVVGIDLATLRDVPHVVAVAGGASKLLAIRAALSLGVIDVLITCRYVAESLATA